MYNKFRFQERRWKNMNEAVIKDMFNELEILEKWYNRDYVTLEMYFQIKSRIIEVNKEKLNLKDDNELPFQKGEPKMKGLIFWILFIAIIIIVNIIVEIVINFITIEFIMTVVYGCLILSIIYLYKEMK